MDVSEAERWFRDWCAKRRAAMPYESYIEDMETMRINYNRMVGSAGRSIWGNASVYLNDPDGGLVRDETGKIKYVRGHPGPMPIDLKAYVVAREYDPDKRSRHFPKIIAELVKHKHELHPYMRRYLLERSRASENRHRKLAESYQAVADQFEIEEQPQSVSRDIAVAKGA